LPLDGRLDGTPKIFEIVKKKKKQFLFPLGIEPRLSGYEIRNPQDPRQKESTSGPGFKHVTFSTDTLQKNKGLISCRTSYCDVYGHQQVAGEHKASVFGSTVCGLRHFPGIPLAFPRDLVSGCMIISYLTQKRVTHRCNNRSLDVRYDISPATKRSRQLKTFARK